EPITLGVLHRYVPNQGTAWQLTLDQLSQFFERVAALPRPQTPPHLPPVAEGEPGNTEPASSALRGLIGSYLDSVSLLGRRTAELHRVLALGYDSAIAPAPFSKLYQRSLYQSMRNLTGRLCERLSRRKNRVPPAARPLVERILADEDVLLQRFRGILAPALASRRIRCHGDY